MMYDHLSFTVWLLMTNLFVFQNLDDVCIGLMIDVHPVSIGSEIIALPLGYSIVPVQSVTRM